MSEGSNIDYSRIERALKWYKENAGGQFVPIVESGSSLREKFVRLEAAIARSKNSFREVEYEGKVPDRIKNLNR